MGSTVRRRLGWAAIAAVGLATIGPTAGSAVPTVGATRFVTASLNAVTLPPHSATAWAIGTHRSHAHSGKASVYVLRSHGATFSKVAIKAPRSAQLPSIAAGSPHAVWAVGSYVAHRAQKPLIERFRGGAFHRQKVNLSGGTSLTAVAASSARNAWAVGDRSDGAPLIARWNGARWAQVAPTGQVSGISYDAVATSGPSNVWFLGAFGATTEITHWNGHSFTITALPLPAGTSLSSIATTSAANTWVVGYTSFSQGSTARATSFTEHFNGATWTRVAAPSPYAQTFPGSVAMSGAKVILAGQGTNAGGTKTVPFVARFAGSHWRPEHVTHLGGTSLFASVSVSTKAAVAVGSWFAGVDVGQSETASNPLAERRHGTRWRKAATPK